VTEGVVDALEAIDVDQQQRERPLMAQRREQRARRDAMV